MGNTLQEMERLAVEHEGLRAQLAERDAEIAALRAQVAELQAWKDAVPVVGIKRLFRDAPYDASYADEVWQWIEKYTLNR